MICNAGTELELRVNNEHLRLADFTIAKNYVKKHHFIAKSRLSYKRHLIMQTSHQNWRIMKETGSVQFKSAQYAE